MSTRSRSETVSPRTAGHRTRDQKLAFNTMLQQAYDELSQSERRFRDLYDNAPDMYHTLDLEGNFVEFNPRHMEFLGYEHHELEGAHISKIMASHCMDRLQEGFGTLMAKGQLPGHEVDLLKKDGSFLTVEVNAEVFNGPDGQPGEIRCIMRDLTERKLLEGQLRQAQKMESLGSLAGGMAHDMNNLLTAVMSHAHLCMQELPPTHRASGDLREVLKTTERAASLVQQLLAFSRRQEIDPKVTDLNDLVTNLERLLTHLLPENVTIEKSLEAGLSKVNLDPNQMEQVLMNLVINARDAMPQGGKVRINTANVTVDKRGASAPPDIGPGGYVVITVSDTGTGIPPEVMEHIFEPFFTTKPEGQGTGLGLALCYGTVKQNHGQIVVNSKLGKGTTFEIYFPQVSAEPDRLVDSPEAEASSNGRETVLVVEDDQTIRQLIARVLTKEGYTVLMAESGEEALQSSRAYEGNIDLLFTDVVMPGMDVGEFIDSVRVERRGIKVMLVSGYMEESIADRGVLTSGAKFLQKPFVPPVLCQKVREALDEKPTAPTKAA